jgi:hypothetical protein
MAYSVLKSLRPVESKISLSVSRQRNLNRGICHTPFFDTKCILINVFLLSYLFHKLTSNFPFLYIFYLFFFTFLFCYFVLKKTQFHHTKHSNFNSSHFYYISNHKNHKLYTILFYYFQSHKYFFFFKSKVHMASLHFTSHFFFSNFTKFIFKSSKKTLTLTNSPKMHISLPFHFFPHKLCIYILLHI